MYTTVLFIVYSICMYLHFYSGQYLYRPSMQLSLYLYKGNSNIENFVFIHPWVYEYYFDFGQEINMISFPFADLSETNMLGIF